MIHTSMLMIILIYVWRFVPKVRILGVRILLGIVRQIVLPGLSII